jgi:hypothetical protein
MAAFKKRLPSTDELLDIATRVDAKATRLGTRPALTGGLALQLYGSSRLTKDVDFLADDFVDLRPTWKPDRKITFGGEVLVGKEGIDVDWIVRNDEYAALYLAALNSARESEDGILVVTPEYLAVMKFAASRPKDYEDLMYLLGQPNLVGIKKATNLVYRFLGGRFAVDQFQAAVEEARWRAEKG